MSGVQHDYHSQRSWSAAGAALPQRPMQMQAAAAAGTGGSAAVALQGGVPSHIGLAGGSSHAACSCTDQAAQQHLRSDASQHCSV
jgi:4-diphosphocytidyl-2C-methyl-D-erythritol kinase